MRVFRIMFKVNNICIIGHKSFIAKNFIHFFSKKYKFFLFNDYFIEENSYSKKLKSFIKINKIQLVINFAANNNNNPKYNDFDKIIKSNYSLPISLIKITQKINIRLILFLSKDSDDEIFLKNFYSLSKHMLKYYVLSQNYKSKLIVLNIDSVFGPMDTNFNRLVPSLMLKIFTNNIKVNLNQNKRLIFVDDLNIRLKQILKKNKKFIFQDISGKSYNIKKIYKYLFQYHKKNISRKDQYINFIKSYNWYKLNIKHKYAKYI